MKIHRENIMRSITILCFGLIFLNSISESSAQTKIIYVKKWWVNGNGTSWSNAYSNLQSALSDAAASSGKKEIWIANGEYKPTDNLSRETSFIIPDNTVIYGGFTGVESTKELRNWRQNRTVLSGDIGQLFENNDNSYHVVTMNGLSIEAGLDGLIITKGNANGVGSFRNSGGGLLMLAQANDLKCFVNNCEFVENNAANDGGGVSIISNGYDAAPRISNTFFNGNKASNGGGLSNNLISDTNRPLIVNCSFSTNFATSYGGAVANIAASPTILNSTFTVNGSLVNGGSFYNGPGSAPTITNCIVWKNFKGSALSTGIYNQIYNTASSAIIKDNIIQGGWGGSAKNNLSTDPLFIKEASFTGKYPRTSIIPGEETEYKYENQLSFDGALMQYYMFYHSYMDHQYNKLYLFGSAIQVIDFNSMTNGRPTSTLMNQGSWGRIQRSGKSVHPSSNRLFVATYAAGLISIDRSTSVSTNFNVMNGEPVSFQSYAALDAVVDNVNNRLYAPIFLRPSNTFYGLLEYDLTNNTKRWITTTSSPISIPTIGIESDESYWGGHRIYLDEKSNTVYYSNGAGVWWWNRGTNATGVWNTTSGIPVKIGSPQLPSNLTTGMYIDDQDNKVYIGTHEGLFVWNRSTGTSSIINSSNSKLPHNLVNGISKNLSTGMIYVSCELGGVLEINPRTGEQLQLTKDVGLGAYPRMPNSNTESSHFDEVDKKMYFHSDAPNGAVWILDYANLLPDYGDLRLRDNSPAIDRAKATSVPNDILFDIQGLNRAVLSGVNGDTLALDYGAYEKPFECIQPTVDFQFTKSNSEFTFSPVINGGRGCVFQYEWNFGDGMMSTDATPIHKFVTSNHYNTTLKINYRCGACSPGQLSVQKNIDVDLSLCGNINCTDEGVAIGTDHTPSGFKLSVAGKVIMEGGTILLSDRWPDFVFDENYKLMSLADLDNYIKSNKHLPGIPSSEEVAKGGIDVQFMSKKLLQKTEELTLYLLQLDERLKLLESSKKR